MSDVVKPVAPRLFLIDGYALIYRAFFALLSRPLQTSRGENTSVAWGIANFLKRLLITHKPELLGWVHDSGATFRDELYADYKATREKLTDELQADFDQGLARATQLLAAYDIPVLAVAGFEADDVIGTLARKGVDAGYNVVIVSGDKDFQQLVRPGVWLLNPGRGGPASVEESWVGVENGSDRLGVIPERVVDYLALVGDSSDNVPGVKGIGEKTAIELINQFGALEEILARATEVTKKRPREALLELADVARLSKQLVTIHCDVPIALDPASLTVGVPDVHALRRLYHELEFTSMLKDLGAAPVEAALAADTAATPSVESSDAGAHGVSVTSVPSDRPSPPSMRASESGVAVLADATYTTVETIDAMHALLRRVRDVPYIAFDTETITDIDSPVAVDAMRAHLVGLSIAIAPGEAYYFPFGHREYMPAQGRLMLGHAVGGFLPGDDLDERASAAAGGEAAVGDSLATAPRRKTGEFGVER